MAGLMVAAGIAQGSQALAEKQGCTACDRVDKKLIRPAYVEVAKKYNSDKDAAAKIAAKAGKGGTGVKGPIPMPAMRGSLASRG